jgi:hypothetical protein
MRAQPPGFYPDPLAPGRERWWDGERWGEHARKAPEAQATGRTVVPSAPPSPPPGPHMKLHRPREHPTVSPLSPGDLGLPPSVAAPPPPSGVPVTRSAPPSSAAHAVASPAAAVAWQPAGFWRRLGGFVVDSAVVVALAHLLVLAANSLLPFPLEDANYVRYVWLDDTGWHIPALDGLEPVLWLFYRGLLEPTRLRTLGQRLFGMRTLAADTLAQVGLRQALHRHLLYSAIALAAAYSVTASLVVLAFAAVEHLMMLPRGGARQTGHDRLAGTVVEVVR